MKILSTGYFAREDTKTPVKVAVIALCINVVLNLVLMGPLAHVGIAIATSVSAWVNCALLAMGLRKNGRFRPDRQLRRSLPRVLAASVAMAAVVWGVSLAIGDMLTGSETVRFAMLGAIVICGAVLYGALAHLSGVVSIADFRHAFGRNTDADKVE